MARKKVADNSIDCVVTSPPYWGLRDYGVPGQLGLEPTYQEHIKNIVELFRAMKPKLKDSATIWLNYGDSYAATVNGTKVKDIKQSSMMIEDL
jgi:DNA modification methylase